MSREVSLGFSPCPNDTFIFYALVHGKIPTEDIRFSATLDDVEGLNQRALKKELDVTKISTHALGFLLEDYCLLQSGGAVGRGCGPLIVAGKAFDLPLLRNKKIGVPGRLTTAYLLMNLYDKSFGDNAVVLPFHRIMGQVKEGKIDAGLVIHEGRFTYSQYGLTKIMDLGAWWDDTTGLPLPLGGIIAKRSLGGEMLKKIQTMVVQSVQYACSYPEEPLAFVRKHAQELDDSVIQRHIELYVNAFSFSLGTEGRRAVETVIRRAREQGLMPSRNERLFC